MQAFYRFYFRQFGHGISYIALVSKLGPETIWGQWKDSIAIFTKHSFVKYQNIPKHLLNNHSS